MATANLPIGTGRTLYSVTDDWFGRLCVAFTILLMLRLAVSMLTSMQTRRRGAASRIKRPEGVVSVELGGAPKEAEKVSEPEEERIYRPPPRPRE
jgi:hypothetical protein